jgi:hypothetical protein
MSNKNPFPKGSMDAALWDYENATNDFVSGGIQDYSWLGDFTPETIGHVPFQEASGLQSIQTDQRLNDLELQALMELEAQSKDGLSARDKAELAKLESSVNRSNAGRQGAIRQNMAARGLAGSGLDFAVQQQSSQDLLEAQALASLEKAAMSQQGRRDATSRMGAMAGSMSERDFNQQAAKAAAQDAINRFNTGNTISNNQFNTNTRNQAGMFNTQGRQGAANNTTTAQNNFRADSLQARQNAAQMAFNADADRKNREMIRRQQEQQRRAAGLGAITGIGGAVIGGVATGGNPLGAMAGYQAGSGLGQAFSFAHGGKVPGEADYEGDDPRNDTVPAVVSPGEVIIPRSIADDPDASADFVAEVNDKPSVKPKDSTKIEAEKAIEGLLQAVNYLSKKRK